MEKFYETEARIIDKMCDDEGLLDQFRLSLGEALDRLRRQVNGIETQSVSFAVLVSGPDGQLAIADATFAIDLSRYYNR